MTVNDPVTERLVRVGSETRAQVLAEEAAKASPDQARDLLAQWFNLCDALEPWLEPLREQFERVIWVTDDPKASNELLRLLPVRVYRAAWEGDQSRALSWTTELERAEWFAKYLTGIRAQWLGIRRDESEGPFVYQGTCTEAYGYLTGRGESEVIAKTVEDIEPIRRLVSVKEAS